MNRVLTIAAAVFIAASHTALAETWIGRCTDGKPIQYNQSIDGNGFLYMTVRMDDGSSATYQMAPLQQTFFNGTAVCGTVPGNGVGNTGEPITELCMNKSRNIIYVKYKHPYENRPVTSGTFCTARVDVR